MSVLWLWLVVAFAFYISNLLHTTHTSRIAPGTLVFILNVVEVWYTATSPGAGRNYRDGLATVRIGCANRLRILQGSSKFRAQRSKLKALKAKS